MWCEGETHQDIFPDILWNYTYLVGELLDASLIFTDPLDRITGLPLLNLNLIFKLPHLCRHMNQTSKLYYEKISLLNKAWSQISKIEQSPWTLASGSASCHPSWRFAQLHPDGAAGPWWSAPCSSSCAPCEHWCPAPSSAPLPSWQHQWWPSWLFPQHSCTPAQPPPLQSAAGMYHPLASFSGSASWCSMWEDKNVHDSLCRIMN